MLILTLLIMMISLNCGKKDTELTPEVASSDEALFDLGKKYQKKDPERARLYFRQLIDSFPKSFYAQQAKLAIADTYFSKADEGNMILASSEYREFIQLYPYSPRAAYAQYQIGMTFYRKALKPGRDQTKTQQALAEFKKVIATYPLSEEAKSAQEKIKDCEERLAAHISEIGRFYYRRNSFQAAVSRLNEIITTFPNYSKMDEVYFYLADSYFQWNKVDESIPYFTKLISDFPESKYAEKAQRKMEEINQNEED